MSATIELTKQLVAIASVTPDDKNCQTLLAGRLEELGFDVEHLPFGDVSNLWATIGESGPLLVFAGHTDVVPAEPVDQWTNNPFQPTERDGFLYGRGTADMKGSIAAMITAAERLLTQQPALKARLGFLITSDEEGQAIDGTRKVVELLQQRQQTIDYCVVGEPSCSKQLGDTLRIGRRGSLSCKLIVKGTGGHVAYPQLANNPIHKAVPALQQLISKQWDTGNQSFPATSFQISNIHSGVGANNVIPETLEVDFNLRYSTELTASAIQKDVENILQENGVDYEWRPNIVWPYWSPVTPCLHVKV